MNKLNVLGKVALIGFMSFVVVNGLWGLTATDLNDIEVRVQFQQEIAEKALEAILDKDRRGEDVSLSEIEDYKKKIADALNEAKRLQDDLNASLTPADDPLLVDPVKNSIAKAIKIIEENRVIAITRNFQGVAEAGLYEVIIYLNKGDLSNANDYLDITQEAAQEAESMAVIYTNMIIQQIAVKAKNAASEAERLINDKIAQDAADAKAKADADDAKAKLKADADAKAAADAAAAKSSEALKQKAAKLRKTRIN